MPSSRVVITFASPDRGGIPWLVEGTSRGRGARVPIAEGLEGEIRVPPTNLWESFGATGSGPELWDSIQVVVFIGGSLALNVLGSLIADWIRVQRSTRGDGRTKEEAGDVEVNVYVNEIRVGSDPHEIAAAVRKAIEDAEATRQVPRDIREKNAAAFGMTLQEYDESVAVSGEDNGVD